MNAIQVKGPAAGRWFYLFIGAVGMLFSGVIYAWSILKAPLEEAFGWSGSALALNFTLTMCCFCIGGILASALQSRYSLRAVLLLSAALSGAGFCFTSRMTGGNILVLYVCYGGLAGLGIGMAYNAVISTLNAWFHDKKGSCSGVLMMSFGFSSLLLGQLASRIIQSQRWGWRAAYRFLGAGVALALLLCALILAQAPPVQKPAVRQRPAGPAGTLGEYTPRQMLARGSFWRFFLYCILVSAIGNTIISFARDLALSFDMADAAAAALVGVLSICNGLGRILCGFLFDGLGRRWAMLAANAAAISAPALILAGVLTHSALLGGVGMCVAGLSYGCCPTISAAVVGSFYGMKHYAANYSLANTMLIPTSFVATAASLLLSATGNYALPCAMLLAFAVVGLGLNLSLRRP